MDCQVCYLPYNTSSRKPKNLLCGHTYCTECLKKLLDESTSTITCPEDRTEFQVPNKQIEDLPTSYSLLRLLPADCLDCHEKPQDGPCIPEHCSKILCPDCKTSHLKKFSAELVVELQAMKKQVSEQQAMCDDDSYLTRMIDQSQAAIAEVTRVFDAEKQKMIGVIREKQEISSSNYFQWKKNFNQCLAQSRSIMDKALSEIQREGDTQSGRFLSDVKKQITEEKKTVLGVEQVKKQLPMFDSSEVQEVFDRMRPDLNESIMPPIPDYIAAEFSQSYGKRGSGIGEFNGPWGVACSPVTGNVAISDLRNHRIHIITTDLRPVRVIGTEGSAPNQFKHARGVCFSSAGHLFIADSSNHRIQEVSEEGQHISTFGSQGSAVDQLQNPCGICWDRGLLYICDWSNYRLQVKKESGEHVRTIGSHGSGPGQFVNPPKFVAVSGKDDKLVVSDSLGSLHFFSSDGVHIKTIQAGQPPYNIKAGYVTIDRLGQILVSDYEEKCLVVLGKNKVITTIRLPAGGKLDSSAGVTLTSDGSVIICDWDKNQINTFTVPRHKQTDACA